MIVVKRRPRIDNTPLNLHYYENTQQGRLVWIILFIFAYCLVGLCKYIEF
nr:MAG TPA: hypothetical protein [Caudoviricetes sp.]